MPALVLALLLHLPAALAARAERDTAEEAAAEEAERVRLAEEMRRYVARNQWAGVERAYQEMNALQLAAPTFDDHWTAALAAEALGDVSGAWERVKAALAVEPRQEAFDWKARIMANYGEVKLTVARSWRGPVALEVDEMPFDPEYRNAIEAAGRALQEGRAYEGLLPLGAYALCGQRFEVLGGPAVAVEVR